MIVTVEVIRGSFAFGGSFQCCAIDDENIRPAVVVIIENCDPGAGGLDDLLLGVHTAEHIHHREAGFGRNVLKVCESGACLRRLISLSEERDGK